jgi:hypothetical protein
MLITLLEYRESQATMALIMAVRDGKKKFDRTLKPRNAPTGTVQIGGGRIDRIHVTLRVYGATLNPASVTKLLKCVPTESAPRRPSTVRDKSGKLKILRGNWRLSVTSVEARSNDLEEVVWNLLKRLPSNESTWKKLKRYKLDLFCGLFMEAQNRGFGISPRLCRELSKRSIAIGFDIYGPDQR